MLASDNVYQLLDQSRWFSPGTPASSTTKTGHHNIAEIWLKVALKHQKSIDHIYIGALSHPGPQYLYTKLVLSFIATFNN
jgi:hypothetical protein